MRKNTLQYILIISMFIAIILIVFLVTKNDQQNVKPQKLNTINYLIINKYDLWEYNSEKWTSLDNFDIDNQFEVYINKKYYGSYNMTYDDKWSIFNNPNLEDDENNLLAFTDNLNIDVRNYTITSIDEKDLKNINKILNANLVIDELTTNEKIILDLNNDGQNDQIINISNVENMESEKYFNFIDIIINNKDNVLVNENYPIEDVFNAPVYNVLYVLDINNAIYNNVILWKKYFSTTTNPTAVMYQFNDNKYQKVVE